MKQAMVDGDLSRIGTKSQIQDEQEAAVAFMDEITRKIVNELIAKHENVPVKYFNKARQSLKIRHVVGKKTRFAAADMRVWTHFWTFRGSRKSAWGDTIMTIRSDFSVNTDFLTERLEQIAMAEYQGDIRAEQKREMTKMFENTGVEVPKDYETEVTPKGVLIRYIGTLKYNSSAQLYKTVKPEKVIQLIAAHKMWIDALEEAGK